MNATIRWLVQPRVSWFHAGDAVRSGLPLADGRLSSTLAELVDRLNEVLAAEAVDLSEFWRAMIALSARTETPAELVEATLRSIVAEDQPISRVVGPLTACAADLEHAGRKLWPTLAQELTLRERPIREQWEARGPGLMRRLIQLAGSDFALPTADVALVQPCSGGGGEAHAPFHFVRLEAVLANPWPILPEPVRLGWLLAQLAPAGPPSRPVQRRRHLAAWALLPLTLEAAEYVEWTYYNQQTLEQALAAWRLPLPGAMSASELASVLMAWRGETAQHTLTWCEMLTELDQRLPG